MRRKWIAALLAAALCLALACAAQAEISIEFIREMPAAHFVAGTDLLYVGEGESKAIASLNGDVLTQELYKGMYYPYDGGYGYFIPRENREGQNICGLMNLDCELIIPCQYGLINMVSEYWAVAMHRVEDEALEREGSYGKYDVFDVYRLTDGQKMASLTYDEFGRAGSAGSRINITNRTTGQTSCYDLDFACVGTDLEDELDQRYSDADLVPYRDDSSYSYGIRSGKTGETVLAAGSAFYITPFVDGYAVVMDEKNGLIDETGSYALELAYDDILASSMGPAGLYKSNTGYCYKVAGYYCVEIEGETCYISESGEVTHTGYWVSSLNNNGLSFLAEDESGAQLIVPAQGEAYTVSGYDKVSCLRYSAGLLYQTTLGEGKGLLDWHGNVLAEPTYSAVEISGDGCFLLLTKDGKSALYRVNYGGLAMEPGMLIGAAATQGNGTAVQGDGAGAQASAPAESADTAQAAGEVQTASAVQAVIGGPLANALTTGQAAVPEIAPVEGANVTFEYVMQGTDIRFVSGSHLLYQGDEATGGIIRNLEGTMASGTRYIMTDTTAGYGYFTTMTYDPDEMAVNCVGLHHVDGDSPIPPRYGKIELISADWAIAYEYAQGTQEEHDEEVSLYGTTAYVVVSSVHVYHLPEGECVMRLLPEGCKSAWAVGPFIAIKQEGDLVAALWNEKGDLCGTASAEDHLIGYLNSPLADVLSGYDRVYQFGNYFEMVRDGKTGLVNNQGEMLLEPMYDAVYYADCRPASDADSQSSYPEYCMGGYYCVKLDGKLRFISALTGELCEAEWPTEDCGNIFGASVYVRTSEGTYGILAPDGHLHVFTEGEKMGTLAAAEGRLFLTSEDGVKLGLMDWDCTVVVPPEYDDIIASGDGEYVMLVKDGVSYVYRICYADPAMTAAPAPARPGEVTAAASETVVETAVEVKTEIQAEAAPAADDGKHLLCVGVLIAEASARLEKDAAGEAANVAALLEGAIALLGENSAAAILGSVPALLESDAAANAAAVKLLLDTAKSLL